MSFHTCALLSAISTAVTSYDNPSPLGPAAVQDSARIVRPASTACPVVPFVFLFVSALKLRIRPAPTCSEALSWQPSLHLADAVGLPAAWITLALTSLARIE